MICLSKRWSRCNCERESVISQLHKYWQPSYWGQLFLFLAFSIPYFPAWFIAFQPNQIVYQPCLLWLLTCKLLIYGLTLHWTVIILCLIPAFLWCLLSVLICTSHIDIPAFFQSRSLKQRHAACVSYFCLTTYIHGDKRIYQTNTVRILRVKEAFFKLVRLTSWKLVYSRLGLSSLIVMPRQSKSCTDKVLLPEAKQFPLINDYQSIMNFQWIPVLQASVWAEL